MTAEAPTRTALSTCNLCEAACGIAVELEGERIVSIRGDEHDPLSRGHVCPKAVALGDVHEDPDRLRRPLRKRGDRWEEIGWDEALDLAATRLAEIQAREGRDAVGLLLGNPTVHNYGAGLWSLFLLGTLGTKNYYSSNSVDGFPRLLVSRLVFGSLAVIPVPDVDRTQLLLIVGANPVVSNGSIMTAPGMARRLKELRGRGGRIVVVDPRRTETAEIADEHHFIRPGTDALLLAAIVRTILDEGLARPGKLEPRCQSLDRLPALLGTFAPERVSHAVGIAPDRIRSLARDFARAPSAVCYGRMGTCAQEFGTLTTWLVDVLNVVTGNMDRPGGAMFTTPAVDLAWLARKTGQTGRYDRWRSRVRGLPEVNGELPVSVLAEQIETPGPGQIRALVTNAANPVLSIPNGRRLEGALERLDFMVSIDIYRNETTRHADLILPPTFGLEHDCYALVFHSLAVRNTARYSQAVLEPGPGTRHDWEVLGGLCERLLRRGGIRGRLAATALTGLARLGPRGLLRVLLRLGPHARRGVSLDRLMEAPHGMDLGPLEPRLFELLGDRQLDLAPAAVVQDLPRLERHLESGFAAEQGSLTLISRRQLLGNNSWMHNSPRLNKGRDRCTLLLHPSDAQARGISSGDRVRLRSRVGQVEAAVEVTAEMMPGVVCLPHGFGHGRDGSSLSVAAKNPGVSINDLIDETLVDVPSGCSAFGMATVTVERCEPGPLDAARTGTR